MFSILDLKTSGALYAVCTPTALNEVSARIAPTIAVSNFVQCRQCARVENSSVSSGVKIPFMKLMLNNDVVECLDIQRCA